MPVFFPSEERWDPISKLLNGKGSDGTCFYPKAKTWFSQWKMLYFLSAPMFLSHQETRKKATCAFVISWDRGSLPWRHVENTWGALIMSGSQPQRLYFNGLSVMQALGTKRSLVVLICSYLWDPLTLETEGEFTDLFMPWKHYNFFFFGRACGKQKFLDQRSNLCHVSDLSHGSNNAWSLTGRLPESSKELQFYLSPKWVSLCWNQCASRAISSWRQGEESFPCLSQLLEINCIPWSLISSVRL